MLCSMAKKTPDITTPATPRRVAFDLLQQIAQTNQHADMLLDQELSRNRLQGADRGLLTELVMGVLRRQGTLDYYLTHLVQRPLDTLELPVLLLLRLGLYQLCYLDRVPAHAAVHETVELAGQAAPRAKGLVNGVLRSFLRLNQPPPFPNQTTHPRAWLTATFSVPDWLAEQWLRQLPQTQAAALAATTLETPSVVLRANRLKTTREQLAAQLSAAGIAAEFCRYAPDAIRLISRCPVPELPGYHEGLWTVQDEASQLVSLLLDPQPGDSVLDMCAAPGGKTAHLAHLMEDRGHIVATDLNQRRVRKIEQTVSRLGLESVQTLVADALQPDYLDGQQFNRILLDAPCSGLGVIRRNPEAKWRLTQSEINRCAERQRQLLQVAARLLQPQGRLVYATCSTAPEEDEMVLDDFLSRHPGFMIDTSAQLFTAHPELMTANGCLRCWPHQHGTDGFFAVCLTRSSR